MLGGDTNECYANSYIILQTAYTPLNVLPEDGDVLVPVLPHLRVHDPEQVEHLVQQPAPVRA